MPLVGYQRVAPAHEQRGFSTFGTENRNISIIYAYQMADNFNL